MTGRDCPVCAGYGEVVKPTVAVDADGHAYVTGHEAVTCDICNGEGVINEPEM